VPLGGRRSARQQATVGGAARAHRTGDEAGAAASGLLKLSRLTAMAFMWARVATPASLRGGRQTLVLQGQARDRRGSHGPAFLPET